MKSFFSAQRTRYTAAVMLFVWLMSLGIGVANACVVQQDHGAREYFGHSRSGTDIEALLEGHAAPDELADGNTSSSEKIACQDFCMAQQSTLVTDHLNGLAHLALVPILSLTGLPVPATDQPLPPEALEGPTWSEPPVSIRYLRLTI